MKGRGELLLYLDLDGVVHHESVYVSPTRGIFLDQEEAPGRVLFEWVDILIELLRPHPEIKLVLSSSWCRRPGYSRTLKRLPEELQVRFVGGTFSRKIHGADPAVERGFNETSRGQQVWSDVLRRQPLDWLAIDDDSLDWPAKCRSNLIKCDGDVGLSRSSTQSEVRVRLAAMVDRHSYRPLSSADSEFSQQWMAKRLTAADMISVGQASLRLGVTAAEVARRAAADHCLSLSDGVSPDLRLPAWQFEEPLWSMMPGILAALDTSAWAALAWLETPVGALDGLTPRIAVERGHGERVLQLAGVEGY